MSKALLYNFELAVIYKSGMYTLYDDIVNSCPIMDLHTNSSMIFTSYTFEETVSPHIVAGNFFETRANVAHGNAYRA